MSEKMTTMQPNTLDELIRVRAAEMGNKPLISYPNTGILDFEDHGADALDRYVDVAATKMEEELGLPELTGPAAANPPVVAILAQSGLHVIVSMIALNRLGYTCFLLSTRLVATQLISLLEMTGCDAVLTTPNFHPVLSEVAEQRPKLKTLPLVMHADYYYRYPVVVSSSAGGEDTNNKRRRRRRSPRSYDLAVESQRTAIIIHSSGSTGLPKPIYLSNSALIGAFSVTIDLRGLLTSPLFHSHGFYEVFRSIYCRNHIYIGNYSFPLTAQSLMDMLNTAKPQVFHCVPYVIKLLAEREDGIEALKGPEIVLFAGSSCPEDLGDMLVKERGVRLVGNYGATETGRLMNSARPEGDKDWNYLRLLPSAQDYVLMDEISPGSGLHECVCLDGLRSKSTINSQDPPNSFRTRDLWTPHPTRPGLWKYACRLDDRFTLVNGEKVLPLGIEGRVRQEKGVREAIVFGEGRGCAGVLVVRADDDDDEETKLFLEEQVYPAVEDANSKAETFARIPRDLVVVVPAGTKYPTTDKGTFIRAAAYKRFEKEIAEAYRRFEEGSGGGGGGGGRNGNGVSNGNGNGNGNGHAAATAAEEEKVKLDGKELEAWLREKLGLISGKEVDAEDDFFASGVDSLQCIQMWGLIRKDLDLGGRQSGLGQNVLYETGNVRKLAAYLEAMRKGEETAIQASDEVRVMRGLIEKYSTFQPHVAAGSDDGAAHSGDVYLLTGATGGLGAHILAQLVNRPDVSAVWALVRASSNDAAKQRVLSSLKERGIQLGAEALAKVVAVNSDLSKPDFGLEASQLSHLKSNLTAVIHSAWAVNFNISVQSFEDQHIKGTHNLIQLCLSTTASSSSPAKFFFCSSVSATGGTPKPGVVAESPAERPEYAQGPGYGRSKYVGEHITINAARNYNVPARVLRIGQLIGDTRVGEWNTNEGIPMMIQTAVTLGALPQLDESMTWLPIDYAASTILDLADAKAMEKGSWDTDLVYHVLNPKRFHWTQEMLPSLAAAGLSFESVSTDEWMERMRASSRDPSKNPPIRLLGWFESKYGGEKTKKKSSGGLEYLTDKTRGDSKTLRRVPDVTHVDFINLLVERLRVRWAEMVKE